MAAAAESRVQLRRRRSAASRTVLASVSGDGLERERVNEIQRARLLAAAGQVACEGGAGNVTVARIVECAGVSRRTFYELFDDCEECLLAALSDALDRVRARVLPAWSSDGDWRERLRASLAELLCLFDEEPVLARLLVVESLGLGYRVLEDRARVLDGVIATLDRHALAELPDSAKAAKPDNGATRLSMEGALGGVLGVLHARIARHAPGRLVELASPLMSMLVLPHHGPVAAQQEASRPVPPVTAAARRDASEKPLRSDPFKDAGMRLTYRTTRVLCALAEHPGSSNRQLGSLAGINDQGQVSKLLSRLERLELIANTGAGPNSGEPNVWTLTPVGRQVTNRIGGRTRTRAS